MVLQVGNESENIWWGYEGDCSSESFSDLCTLIYQKKETIIVNIIERRTCFCVKEREEIEKNEVLLNYVPSHVKQKLTCVAHYQFSTALALLYH